MCYVCVYVCAYFIDVHVMYDMCVCVYVCYVCMLCMSVCCAGMLGVYDFCVCMSFMYGVSCFCCYVMYVAL